MKLRSMTGWGQGEATSPNLHVTVQMRAVNHKQLDPRVHLPSTLVALEPALVKRLRAALHRGRVDARVHVTVSQDAAESRWAKQIGEASAKLRKVASSAELAAPTFADVVRFVDHNTDSDTIDADEASAGINEAFEAALASFVAFRTREGEDQHALFASECERLSTSIKTIAALSARAMTTQHERLRERVTLLVGDAVSPERLVEEVAVLAQRADIAEEIQRAGAHVSALQTVLEADGPHGKRLDFLLQELIRETNTMASKSNSAELTHHVVDAKARIERLREQAMNVE